MEYNSIAWMDTSIFWSTGRERFEKTVRKFIINKKSSLYFYVHEAGHTMAWATHANMFAFFPSNMTEMGTKNDNKMKQANGVILFNTEDLKNNIIKYVNEHIEIHNLMIINIVL